MQKQVDADANFKRASEPVEILEGEIKNGGDFDGVDFQDDSIKAALGQLGNDLAGYKEVSNKKHKAKENRNLNKTK